MNLPSDHHENPYQSPALEASAEEEDAEFEKQLSLEITGGEPTLSEALKKLFQQVWSEQRPGLNNPLRRKGQRFVLRIRHVKPGSLWVHFFTLGTAGYPKIDLEFSQFAGQVLQFSKAYTASVTKPTSKDFPRWKFYWSSHWRERLLRANCRELMVKAVRDLAKLNRLTLAQRSRLLRPIHDDTLKFSRYCEWMGAGLGLALAIIVYAFPAAFPIGDFGLSFLLLGLLGGMLFGKVAAFIWKRVT